MSNIKKYRKMIVQSVLDEIENIKNGKSGYTLTKISRVCSNGDLKGFELDYVVDGVSCLIQLKYYESIDDVELRISMKSVCMSCTISKSKGELIGEIQKSIQKVGLPCLH